MAVIIFTRLAVFLDRHHPRDWSEVSLSVEAEVLVPFALKLLFMWLLTAVCSGAFSIEYLTFHGGRVHR